MTKKFIGCLAVFFLVITLCLSFAQHSYAYTTIYLDSVDGPLADIAGIQFDILGGASVDNFTASLPGDWMNMSLHGKDTFNAFSAGGSSLVIGQVGVFDIDVTLDNWVLADQNAMALTLGSDYQICHSGTDYHIVQAGTSCVPIPGAIWLLGSGLFGLVAIRRRRVKA